MADTASRFRAFAERIASVSPTYAAWALAVADDAALIAVLDTLPPTQRMPELVFAVARRLGADPHDPEALRAFGREARIAFASTLASATMQTNDPRRLAAVLPLFADVPGPIGLVDVGASAGLCSVPDAVTLEYRTALGPRRIATAAREPSFGLTAEASGAVPDAVPPIDVVARIALDPNPIDLSEPTSFDRLVAAVPPEATDRTALMREAALATLAAPPDRIRGSVPGDLDAALDRLPDGCTPVVMTTGTLVYVPGRERQAFVDRVRERGVRWIAMERTGILTDVAATLPTWVDPDDPAHFATVSLDGVAVAVADPHGTRVHWFDS